MCNLHSITAAKMEASAEAAIAACDGDARAAVRALLVAVNYLEAEVERQAIWPRFGRIRLRTLDESQNRV
jgi:hypothetical protein